MEIKGIDGRLTITVNELIKATGISRSVAYFLCELPGFPIIRIGKRILISVEGLKKWLKDHEGKEVDYK